MNYKDILIRALKTFVQAFIPVVISAFAAADLTEFDSIKTVGYSALISGVAAGISAVWNVIVQVLDKPKEMTVSVDEVEIDDEGFDEGAC